MDVEVAGRLPRYFWRRAFAFLVDWIVVVAVLFAVLFAVRFATGIDLGVPQFMTTTRCKAAPPDLALVREVEAQWPLGPGETRINLLCRIDAMGKPPAFMFHTNVTSVTGGSSWKTNRTVSTLVDEAGNELPMTPGLDLSFPIALGLFSFMEANGRRSPGKRLMSLRVRTEDARPLGWPTALGRTCLKFLPALLIGGVYLYTVLIMWSGSGSQSAFKNNVDQMKDGMPPGILWMFGLGLFTLVWWFGPFFVWRGRTFYDRFARTEVVRVEKA
jgi:uncharacterized RDD family membrane protein YckC